MFFYSSANDTFERKKIDMILVSNWARLLKQ